MAGDAPCPGVRELDQLLSGQLPDDQAEWIEQHLLNCTRCVGTMRTLKDQGTLVDALRGRAGPVEVPEGPEVESLVRRMHGLTRGFAGASSEGDTLVHGPPSSAGDTMGLHDGLSPPRAPGELGRLGPYRVLRVLGTGGMGVVYAAEDPQLERAVALKVMKPEVAANPDSRERFLREARAVAAIEHEHIVSIYQVGEDNGVLFLAMPLLRGETLENRVARGGRLPLAEVLRIGRETAEGLAAAHGRGLIHRDIKPSNLWLEGEDARVKIVDFGLARRDRDGARLTRAGTILGTPSYMPPEQASGETLDGRSDLYSLGVVLYWLGAGRLPFPQEDLLALLSAVATETPPALREFNRDVPPTFVDLVMRMLAKRPEQRPATARVVVEELRAIERGTAHPRSAGAWKLPRALVGITVLAVGILVGAVWVFEAGRVKTTDSGSEPVPPTAPATAAKSAATPAPAPAVGLVRSFSGHQHSVTCVAFSPDGKQAVTGSWDRTVRLWDVATGQPVGPPRESNAGAIGCVAFSPGGKRIAFAGADGTVRLWDPASGEERVLQGHRKKVTGVCFGPEGRLLASVGLDGSAQEWNGLNGKGLSVLSDGRMGPLECVAVSPDGMFLLCAGQNQDLHLWQIDGERYLRGMAGHAGVVQGVAFAPNGQLAASGGSDGTVRIWKLDDGKQIHALKSADAVQSVAFTPDGKRVLAGYRDGAVRLWGVANGREVHAYPGHKGRTWSVAVSPDGRYALSGGDDRLACLWGLPPDH